MKKVFISILAVCTVAFMFNSCQKPSSGNNNKGNDNNEQPNNETPGGNGESGEATYPEISIDGNFSDWDAITDAVASNSEYADVIKGGASDPIQVIKVAASPDGINFYFEFQADLLPQNESSGTWGNSYEENTLIVGDGDDDYREVMHLFIDPDSNGRTGFLTFPDPEDDSSPAIPDLGSEMCAQFFMYFKPSLSEVCVAFEQTLIGPSKTGAVGEEDQVDENGYTGDYDYNGTFCQEWPDSGDEAAFPLWGWQNPDNSGTGDNDCPRPSNWKSGKVEGSGIVKVEFLLEKDDIVNMKDSDEELACGVIFDWDEIYQATGVLRVSYVK